MFIVLEFFIIRRSRVSLRLTFAMHSGKMYMPPSLLPSWIDLPFLRQ